MSRSLTDRARTAEARTGALTKHRNTALQERNALLAQLSHYWPAYLVQRRKGPDMILVMRNPHLPNSAPEASWLIFRQELQAFEHLERRENTIEGLPHDQRLKILRGTWT